MTSAKRYVCGFNWGFDEYVFIVALLSCGAALASINPYKAIVGIDVGLSSAQYALVSGFGSVCGVVASVGLGYVSDKVRDRRLIIGLCSIVGAISCAIIAIFESKTAFVFAVCVAFPLSGSLFSQLFSLVRAHYDEHAQSRSTFMVSFLRAVFAVSWILIPPILGMYVARHSVFDVYAAACFFYGVCGAVFVPTLRLKRLDLTPKPLNRSADQFARTELKPGITSGVIGLTFLKSAMALRDMVLPLVIVKTLSGDAADIGRYFGLVAAIEVPFMILWAGISKYCSKEAIIVFNGVLYAIFSLLASSSSSAEQLYWLAPINAIAGSALLTFQISYLQDAIKGKIGLSTSVSDVVGIAASCTSAALFWYFVTGDNYQIGLVGASGCFLVGSLIVLLGNYRRVISIRLGRGLIKTQP